MSDPSNWDKKTVVRHMTEGVGTTGLVSAMVFLNKGSGPVEQMARDLVAAAAQATGADEARQSLSRIRQVSRAFAVKVEPKVLEEIARSDVVKNILPSQVDDVLPQPANRRAVS